MEIKVDHVIPESLCEEPGKGLVRELRREGRIIESEGTLGIDLKEYGLGYFMLLKSDGTALYSTKDFGLIQLKANLGNFDKYIYVVGSEQEFYFKQLFKTYQLLGLAKGEHHHLSHGLVTLKEGKMASRLGNVILYEDLRDEMMKMALDQINKKNPKLKSKKNIGKKIAFAAIKYSMLNIENNKPIKFDWDQAMDTNGRSGPYLQYTFVRAASILGKSKLGKFDASLLREKAEIDILKKLAEFPGIVKKAADSYSPHEITTYLFELAQLFNGFYHLHPVLIEDMKLRAARLALVKAVSLVLEKGLELLGIETVREM